MDFGCKQSFNRSKYGQNCRPGKTRAGYLYIYWQVSVNRDYFQIDINIHWLNAILNTSPTPDTIAWVVAWAGSLWNIKACYVDTYFMVLRSIRNLVHKFSTYRTCNLGQAISFLGQVIAALLYAQPFKALLTFYYLPVVVCIQVGGKEPAQ